MSLQDIGPDIILLLTYLHSVHKSLLAVLVRFLPLVIIITEVINHDLGNRMLGQARPNSITQVMIYNLGYDL